MAPRMRDGLIRSPLSRVKEATAPACGSSATIARASCPPQEVRGCCTVTGCTRRSTRPSAARCARWSRRSSCPSPRSGRSAEEFPRELFTRFGELGFLGPQVPGGVRGLRLPESSTRRCCWRSWAAAARAASPRAWAPSSPSPPAPLHLFGTDDQKRRFLAPAIRGEKIGALGITEPDAGSDVAGLRTTARRDGDALRGQRLEDVHHQRRARGLRGARGEDGPARRPQGPVHARSSRRARRASPWGAS